MRHYLAYLTANDRPRYQADFLNFRHMTRLHPGVPKVSLYVAISAVRSFDDGDRGAIDALLAMAGECPWLEPKVVLWKGNIGRDFSSAEACLRAIGEEAGADDYVMVRNRSGYGPFKADWYQRYVAQYARFPGTGLVGSTISFAAHPKRPRSGPATHVQTYAYLSEWRHFESLAAAYPAARCVDRFELIDEGEIGLSSTIMDAGLGISCLHWPDELFTAERPHAAHLPQVDIKKHARDLPFRYKYKEYLEQPSDLPAQLGWWLRGLRSPASELQSGARHIVLDTYG